MKIFENTGFDEEQRQDNKDQVDKYLEENLLESKI
jgi:hypothetical protein